MFPTECGLYHTKYFVVFFYTTTAATMKDWKATAIEKYGVDDNQAEDPSASGGWVRTTIRSLSLREWY